MKFSFSIDSLFGVLDRLRAATISMGLCFFTLSAHAASTVPLEDFFKTPQFSDARLSPNGKFLAVKTSIKGRFNLAVVDLETRAVTPVAGYEDMDIRLFHWISNDRIVFDVSDHEPDNTGVYSGWLNNRRIVFDVIGRESDDSVANGNGLYAVNRDGSNYRELKSTVHKQVDKIKTAMQSGGGYKNFLSGLSFVDSHADESNDILVEGWSSHSDEDIKAYKLNVLNGAAHELLLKVAGIMTGFVADKKQQIRVVVTRENGEKKSMVWYRDDDSQPFRKLAEFDRFNPDFHVIGFDADDKTMYVSARAGSDKSAIYKYDFVNNKVGEQVAADPDVDIVGGLIFDSENHKLLGVHINSEPPRTQWIDEGFAKAQNEIDATFPDRINVLSGNLASRLLVYSYSATDPGAYSLYDPVGKKLEHLFQRMPWIKPDQMADQLVFDYTARDGLHVPSYLTVPKDRKLKSLPLIVLVRGEPWARDYWGFDPQVQFFANRGYAVLQPEFRGSTGFGWSHYIKGMAPWGSAMKNDIADGIDNLVKQGAIDPARIHIIGASYSGYDTLMNMSGVADMQTAKPSIPIFLEHGTEDIRGAMHDALQVNRRQVEWLGSSEENRYKVYGAIEKSLSHDAAMSK